MSGCVGWHQRTLRCLCHGLDCCPAYEAWCSEMQAKKDWEALTQDERDAVTAEVAAWEAERRSSADEDLPF